MATIQGSSLIPYLQNCIKSPVIKTIPCTLLDSLFLGIFPLAGGLYSGALFCEGIKACPATYGSCAYAALAVSAIALSHLYAAKTLPEDSEQLSYSEAVVAARRTNDAAQLAFEHYVCWEWKAVGAIACATIITVAVLMITGGIGLVAGMSNDTLLSLVTICLSILITFFFLGVGYVITRATSLTFTKCCLCNWM